MITAMLTSRNLPIGIDFGASGAKLVQLRQSGSNLSTIAAVRVDADGFEANPENPQWMKQLVSAVGRRIRSGEFRGNKCVISFDDRLLRSRSVRQPRLPDAEADRAAQLDAPARLGFANADSCQVGWLRGGEVRQGDELRDELIYVGAPREPIERLVFMLAEEGLCPLAVEPGFVACGRCFSRTYRRAADQDIVRIVVDVGLQTTGVMLLRGSSVAFYKQLELGGRAMTQKAAERLNLDPATVADLRRQRMLHEAGLAEPIDPKVDRALYEAVRPMLGDLAHEVKLCTRYYSVTFRGAKPVACFVVGGEACEPRLVNFLRDELQVETSVGRPLADLPAARGSTWARRRASDERRGTGTEWAVGAGLSMRLAHNPKRRVTHRIEDVPSMVPETGPQAAAPRKEAA